MASVGNYAERIPIQFVREAYQLNIGYIYNEESFLIGKKAKILLNARLTLSDIIMNLELLTNIKVTATVTNSQGITT